MTGRIRTVTGDVDPPDGTILVHEHLQIDLSHNKGPQTVIGPDDVDDVIADLREARALHGLALVADLSVPGSGRDPAALRRISEASGVGVIAATGFYWDPIHPDVMHKDRDALAAQMRDEIETGILDTGVCCGVIKIGTDAGAPPPEMAKLFAAAAQAQAATGAAIICHTSTPDQAHWQIDVLEKAGATLERVLVSHLHTLADFGELERIASRGVKVGFDQIGFASGPSYHDYAELIHRAVNAGLIAQVMISTDVARRVRLRRHGGTSYGTLFSELLPALRARGITDDEIDILVRRNPGALLALAR